MVGDCERWRHTLAKQSCCYNRLGLFLGHSLGLFLGDPTHCRKTMVIFHSLDHYPLLHIHMDTKAMAKCRSGLQSSGGKVNKMGLQAMLTCGVSPERCSSGSPTQKQGRTEWRCGNLRRGFSVFREMVSGIPWESALKGNRAQVS